MNYITCSLKCGTLVEKEIFWEEEDYYCRECILLFWGLTSCGDSIFEEVAGFSPFMVSPIKTLCVSCLLWSAYVLLLCLLFSQWKDPKIIMLAYIWWKTNMVSELTWEEDTVQLQELGLPSLWIFLHRFSAKVRWNTLLLRVHLSVEAKSNS